MAEDEVLRRAMEAAAKKRSSPNLDRLKPPAFKMPPMAAEYCPTCQYPLRSRPCEECSRRAQEDARTREEWKVLLGGEKAWTEYTRDRYVQTEYNKQAYAAAIAFNWRKGNFLLHGPRGTGKTHLATIMKRPWVMAGVKVKTVFMQDELRAAKGDFKKKHESEDRILPMVNAPVLSLEDIGVEKPSDWVVNEWYYPIIDGRYRAGRNGLIITMNQTLEELENRWAPFDPYGRIISRMKEMCKGNIYSLFGERDWREA